ncbi:hypothetical protein RirG_221610 [Rhizophagus irregularis DAOM 197198w]|uniref:Uncharacterized protein n=1 Tax=Rhizophagus irregularis (strain DAOM 197198w) TaxID=1432141 RepID=A0A015JLN1_RHIIW|nr:hypothetical protein RirG_221610 [Rhizophagus irregularis DAOM 197198w]
MTTNKRKGGCPQNEVMKYGSIIRKASVIQKGMQQSDVSTLQGHIANHCPNAPPHLIRKYQKVFEEKADNNKKRKFSNQTSLYDYHDTDEPLPQGRID